MERAWKERAGAWVEAESHPRAPPSARTERARCTHGLHARFTPRLIRHRTTRVTAPLYTSRRALHIHIGELDAPLGHSSNVWEDGRA